MTLLLQELIIGITTGAIYALIALGYTMVYGIIELINFAHGDIFMIGTFVCVSIFAAFGITNSSTAPTGFALVGVLLITLLGAMAVCAVLGVVIERVAYRPLRNAPRLAPFRGFAFCRCAHLGILNDSHGPVKSQSIEPRISQIVENPKSEISRLDFPPSSF